MQVGYYSIRFNSLLRKSSFFRTRHGSLRIFEQAAKWLENCQNIRFSLARHLWRHWQVAPRRHRDTKDQVFPWVEVILHVNRSDDGRFASAPHSKMQSFCACCTANCCKTSGIHLRSSEINLRTFIKVSQLSRELRGSNLRVTGPVREN
jgi:hypothetical protein